MHKKSEYIYGVHAVTEALKMRPDIVLGLFHEPEKHPHLIAMAQKHRIPVQVFSARTIPGNIPIVAPHQGIVAAVDISRLMVSYKTFMENLAPNPHMAVAILGEIQDPHNVGAIIRSAAGFGLSGVFVPPHRQASVTATVVKVSAGMALRIPVVEISNVNTTINDLKRKGFWVYGLAGEGATDIRTERFDRPSAFVIGNEGEGLREKTRQACDTLLRIPLHPRTESLNASVAAALTFYAWSGDHPEALTI